MRDAGNRMEIRIGDITALQVDVVVNAANPSLLGGGGVDGAIHRAAGPGLLAACTPLGGCPRGEARITGGFDLPASHIIHAVGPVWCGGAQDEDHLLASCYRAALGLAAEIPAATIAFPAISTGVYRFPKRRAAEIAVGETAVWLRAHDVPHSVIFCCFQDEDAAVYRHVLSNLRDSDSPV